MSVKRLEVGKRMSQVVIHNGIVYLAGQVAESKSGQSVAEQTADILSQIDTRLAAAGSDKSKLIRAVIWLTDMSSFGEMNEVWDAWVEPGSTPVRACVGSPLAAPQFNVEIMVEAAI